MENPAQRFPSPSGASHFLIVVCHTTRSRYIVSVPFRGISFPNITADRQIIPILSSVSVPFRGISFPNFIMDIRYYMSLNVSVPFRGISFPNPIPHTPHSMRPHRAFCVGKPNRSIFHVLRLSKIPANPAFKPCAGKSSSPSLVTHFSLPL